MSSTTRRTLFPSQVRSLAALLRAALLAAGLAAGGAAASSGTVLDPFAGRPEVQAFVDRVASEHGFAPAQLHGLLRSIDPNPRVLELMNPPPRPGGQRSWRAYRQRFVERPRIDAGLRFWFEHDTPIARAFGVSFSNQNRRPASIRVRSTKRWR